MALLLVSTPFLSGCSGIGKKGAQESAKSKGYYKVGSPYRIKGKKYRPAIDYGYNKTGIASWYGPNFHGKQTANGEIFNQNELTAAHKTLPLPSIVRVTNLENGKSLIARVNDRGPYAHGRIIDMSKRSAELLGFKNNGVAKVRVQVLETESRLVADAAKSGRNTQGMEVAMNKSSYESPRVIQVAAEEPYPAYNPQPVESQILTESNVPQKMHAIPGHTKEGKFYPDPIISEYPVHPQKIFIQTGSFSSRENAMKAASALDKYGRAQIHDVAINGEKYYRVRFPANDVSAADRLLSKILAGGHKNALIVVD